MSIEMNTTSLAVVMARAEIPAKLNWYIARSSGIVAAVVLTASVVWGLLLSARVINKQTTPGWLLDLHRYLGALGVVFTGVHIGGLVGDNWLHFGWKETLQPMGSSWRPGAVTWGVVGFYLLVAIELTSLLRRWLPRKLWRMVHYASFPLFGIVCVHAIQSGHDTSNRVFSALMVASVTLVVGFAALRVTARRKVAREVRQPAKQVAEPAKVQALAEAG